MILEFRAWYIPFKDRTIGQEMKYGQARRLITHAEMAPDKCVLMQSTELKDKDGVGMFEGDVVSVNVRNGFDYLDNKVCIVENSVNYSELVCVTVDESLECQTFNTEPFEKYAYKVIGSIYENSELPEIE